MFLPDLPIYSSKFILNGNQALFTGNRKHFYFYDMNSNKLEKVSSIIGHQNENSLSKLFVNNYPDSESDMFGIAG